MVSDLRVSFSIQLVAVGAGMRTLSNEKTRQLWQDFALVTVPRHGSKQRNFQVFLDLLRGPE